MEADYSARSTSATEWTFLFHAEFTDAATGLYNYGYRYYHPQLGRWLSRDPIEIKGGVNLYGFVGNAGSGQIDNIGHGPIGEPIIRPDADGFYLPVPVGIGTIIPTIKPGATTTTGHQIFLPGGEFVATGDPLPPNAIFDIKPPPPKPGDPQSIFSNLSPLLIFEIFWMTVRYPCWNLTGDESGKAACHGCCQARLITNSIECQASFYIQLKFCGQIKHPIGFTSCIIAIKAWSINCQVSATKYHKKCMERCGCKKFM